MKRSRFALPREDYKKLCNDVMTRDKWRCVSCRSREQLAAHHIIYRSQLGGDYSSNLVSLCDHCHRSVHNRFILVVAKSGILDEPVNADEGIKLIYLQGWKPKGR